jgi:hypothetical protein
MAEVDEALKNSSPTTSSRVIQEMRLFAMDFDPSALPAIKFDLTRSYGTPEEKNPATQGVTSKTKPRNQARKSKPSSNPSADDFQIATSRSQEKYPAIPLGSTKEQPGKKTEFLTLDSPESYGDKVIVVDRTVTDPNDGATQDRFQRHPQSSKEIYKALSKSEIRLLEVVDSGLSGNTIVCVLHTVSLQTSQNIQLSHTYGEILPLLRTSWFKGQG